MIKVCSFLIVVFFMFGCQNLGQDVSEPVSEENNFSVNEIAKDLTLAEENLNIFETGYWAHTLASDLTAPEGTAINLRTGELLVGQSTTGNILAFNRFGMSREFAQIPFEEPPAPALIDLINYPFRGILATFLRHGKIFQISNYGTVTEFATGLNFPLFMALDYYRNLYLTELFSDCVTMFKPSGERFVAIEFEPGWMPRGIVLDFHRNLYVMSGKTGEIICFDVSKSSAFPISMENGDVIATVPPEEGPQDITFGFERDLFVVTKNSIFKINLNGEVSVFADGLVGPYNTINSTPTGEIIVTDYAQNMEGNGKVYLIVRNYLSS